MASAGGKGTTIALVVFVILWIISTTVAYIFFDKTDQLAKEAQGAKSNEAAAKKALTDAKSEYDEIRQRSMGGGGAESHKAVVALIEDDLTKPKLIPIRLENKKRYENYKSGLKYLEEELTNADQQLEALTGQKTNLEREARELKKRYQQDVDVNQDASRKAREELVAEQQKMKAQIDEKDQRIDSLQTRYQKLRDDHEQLSRDADAADRKAKRTVGELQKVVENLQRQLDTSKDEQFTRPDGEIVEVFDGGKSAHVNIGVDDGLRVGTSFGIYGKDSAGNPTERPKAKLEVVRFLAGHRAMCTIRENSFRNPVMRGDLIYNPVWSPGDLEGIAFTGFVYLDDDNQPDNERFKQLVTRMGGRIDAEFNLKAQEVKGQVSIKTAWLVVGDVPETASEFATDEEKGLIEKLRLAESRLRREAQDSGVRVINIRNFLTYMGHNEPIQSVPAGGEGFFLNRKNKQPYEKLRNEEKKSSAFGNAPVSKPAEP